MAITSQELGRRIRAAREASRITQEAVAKHLGLSRPTVVQLEAGNRGVSSLELDKLAYLFGRDLREFMADSFEESDTFAALFRAQPEVLEQPDVMKALRDCKALGHELTNLERLVGIDRDSGAVASYPIPLPATRWEAIQQGKRLAEEERRRLGLGSAPLPDLAELLETQGVRTGVVELPDDISGLMLSEKNVGLFVVANRRHAYTRCRFSLAHEYAHVVADRARVGLVSRASQRDDLAEVRANAFAANFLMPESGVRQFVAGLGKGKPSRGYAEVFDEAESLAAEGRAEPGSQLVQLYDVAQLAHYFGVSRVATLYRLWNLRLVTEAEFEKLKMDDLSKGPQVAELLGLPDPDDSSPSSDLRHRLLGLALEAYRREEISRSKLNELGAMVGVAAEKIESLIADSSFGRASD